MDKGTFYLQKIRATDRPWYDSIIHFSSELGIKPEWMVGTMFLESSLNPQAVNPRGGASGLIQFMPHIAPSYGTTVEDIRKMSAVEQMPYVYKHFKPYKGRMKSIYDVYLAVFFPAGIGKPDHWPLSSSKLSAETVRNWNAPYDLDSDGDIEIGELKQIIDKKLDIKKPLA